jgi:glutathione S-transferase
VYFPHIIRLMGPEDDLQGEAALAAIAAANNFYAEMEQQLADRDYLAGDFSFADIAFYMTALFGERKGAPLGEETPRLLAWRDRMTQRPAVRSVAGAMGRWLASVGRPVPAFLRGL